MDYSIKYGKTTLQLTVSDKRIVGILKPQKVEEVENVEEAVAYAIANPYESAPLHEMFQDKKKALIITVDNTRPSPRKMLQPIVSCCEKQGLSVSVIIATGRHRKMTQDELNSHLGTEIIDKCSIFQHDAFDENVMVNRGKTSRGTLIKVNKIIYEHDIVIGCGIIEPSYLCGWSGGRKLLMPGLAHHESIDNNHFYLTHPDTKIGRLHGNPVSDDAAEFAKNLPFHFIVYSISGPDDEVTEIIAGHPVKAHEKACNLSRKIYDIGNDITADIVISSAGGHPYDCDLVQGKKAIIPTLNAVNPDGVIILCAECSGGLGAEKTFTNWMTNKTPEEVTRDVLDRKQFCLGAHGANILARPIVQKNAKIIIVTCEDVANELKNTFITAVTSISDAWQLANQITGDNSSAMFIEKARRLIS